MQQAVNEECRIIRERQWKCTMRSVCDLDVKSDDRRVIARREQFGSNSNFIELATDIADCLNDRWTKL